MTPRRIESQQCTQMPQNGAERPFPPICVHSCVPHGCSHDPRVATVYTNAPKRPREAVLADLCTLLPHRRGGDATTYPHELTKPPISLKGITTGLMVRRKRKNQPARGSNRHWPAFQRRGPAWVPEGRRVRHGRSRKPCRWFDGLSWHSRLCAPPRGKACYPNLHSVTKRQRERYGAAFVHTPCDPI